MAQLRTAEREYCLKHGIPLSRLFDAEGLKRAVYKEIMGKEERWAAFGVKPCLRGHVLRNRHGYCLMCNSQSVAHLLRAKQDGYVYIAVGARGQLMKIGYSQNPKERIKIANYDGWGGYHDWHVFAQAWSRKAGKIEHELMQHFGNSRVSIDWVRNGKVATTREAFISNTDEALSKLVWLCDAPPEIMHV